MATKPLTIDQLDLVSIQEIAERLDCPRVTVEKWRQRSKAYRESATPEWAFPEPRWTLAGRGVWEWTLDILPWLTATGRDWYTDPKADGVWSDLTGKGKAKANGAAKANAEVAKRVRASRAAGAKPSEAAMAATDKPKRRRSRSRKATAEGVAKAVARTLAGEMPKHHA